MPVRQTGGSGFDPRRVHQNLQCNAGKLRLGWNIAKKGVLMETITFIESGMKRKGVKKICPICKCEFVTRVHGGKETCSIGCRGIQKRTEIEVTCFNCGKKFFRVPSHLKNSKHRYCFCSRVCKEVAQSLVGKCPNIRPSHYGSKLEYRNSLTNEMVSKGCIDCGEKRPYRVVIHHVDGDRTNNVLSNLEVVCFSHHGIRHLSLCKGEWVYNPRALTPRELLLSL